MLKYLILPIWICAVALPALELNRLEPGKSLIPEKTDGARSRLFTDGKPAGSSLLRPFRKDSRLELDVRAVAPEIIRITVPENAALPFTGEMSAALDIDQGPSAGAASFAVRFENFQLGKGCRNVFFFIAGGVHLQFRGDTRDVRYFDGTRGKYVILQKLSENEWHSFSIVFGQETFEINGCRDIRLRGNPVPPRFIQWNSRLDQGADAKPPIIQLKEIKVK